MIGNPPWERLKVQEREFFAFTAPEIAGAVSAATRRQKIAELESGNPELYAAYCEAQDRADRTLTYARRVGPVPADRPGRHQHLHAVCRIGPADRHSRAAAWGCLSLRESPPTPPPKNSSAV